MKPPSSGPITGPISAGTVSQAMAPTMSALVTERRRTRRPTGTIMAPPKPCSMRAATSCHRELLSPHRIEPVRKTTMAPRKTFFAPYRSATQPLIGMNTARLNR